MMTFEEFFATRSHDVTMEELKEADWDTMSYLPKDAIKFTTREGDKYYIFYMGKDFGGDYSVLWGNHEEVGSILDCSEWLYKSILDEGIFEYDSMDELKELLEKHFGIKFTVEYSGMDGVTSLVGATGIDDLAFVVQDDEGYNTGRSVPTMGHYEISILDKDCNMKGIVKPYFG